MPRGNPAAGSGPKGSPPAADFLIVSSLPFSLRVTVAIALTSLAGCAAFSVTDPLDSGPPSAQGVAADANSAAGDAGSPAGEAGRLPARATELVAVGFASVAAQSGSDVAQRRVQAARAAKLDAYRSLAEQLHGVELSVESFVEDGKVRQDVMRARISGAIDGVEIVSIEPLGSDSYQATLRLPARPAVP
jgi:hypothetical protein